MRGNNGVDDCLGGLERVWEDLGAGAYKVEFVSRICAVAEVCHAGEDCGEYRGV